MNQWLACNTRVHFHFTPTSASWLKLVARCFDELAQRQIRCLAVAKVDQPLTITSQYIEQRNENPTPFVWTATVSQILKKIGNANAILATQHSP